MTPIAEEVTAVISPLDTLGIATYNGAVFLGKADQLGSVDKGLGGR